MDNINSSGSSEEFEPSETSNGSNHQEEVASTDAMVRRRKEIEKFELARREEILSNYERRTNE